MDYRELVELEAQNTIGYAEAVNKESFMTGVSVAISKLEIKYKRQIEELEQQLKYTKINSETYEKDLKTLASIVNRYSEGEY
jgi:hypothetical protein